MDKIIFFAALVLFPFGQLLKIGIVSLFDIAVLLLAMITLWRRPKYPNWYRYFVYFLVTCIFGLLINFSLFSISSAIYLLRLWSYSMVSIYVSNFVHDKKTIPYTLITISAASAMLGWIQYFIWPDLWLSGTATC